MGPVCGEDRSDQREAQPKGAERGRQRPGALERRWLELSQLAAVLQERGQERASEQQDEVAPRAGGRPGAEGDERVVPGRRAVRRAAVEPLAGREGVGVAQPTLVA